MVQLESAGSPSTVDVATLSHRRRRLVLDVLRERGRPLALADLAADVVRAEAGRPDADPDYEAIRRCRLELYHTHVPKLAAADLVRFDPADRTVRYVAAGPLPAPGTAGPGAVRR